MGEAVIRVDGLGKCYRLGDRQESYKTLRDALAAAARKPFRVIRRLLRAEDGGLASATNSGLSKDVSFEVQRGEVLGVIGRNGAGKSTLLKILSRITEPTEGGADIHGRVGSLLEVGTGFHPELTGRENIYLNGAILGMKRAEIESKFDEIVAFAEVERFIDTPVKHYSSGMYLRLAFAVAAHLEPEILLVDEVLAVGDAAFQKKCLGKMSDVASRGRTVLFVSHNLAAINQLCDRCLVLEGGRLERDASSAECVDYYLRAGTTDAGTIDTDTLSARGGTGGGWISRVEIVDKAGQRTNSVGIGEPFTVRLQAIFRERVARAALGLEVVCADGRANPEPAHGRPRAAIRPLRRRRHGFLRCPPPRPAVLPGRLRPAALVGRARRPPAGLHQGRDRSETGVRRAVSFGDDVAEWPRTGGHGLRMD